MAKQLWKPGNMIYPLPAVMVSVTDGEGNDNIITVAWTGTVCTNPAMAYISVHITSRTDPAEIRCKRQLLRCQIDHKFTRFPDHIIGITGRSDRNISHRRL